MPRRISLITCICLCASAVAAINPQTPIKLPAPDMQGGKALMVTLKDRASCKTFKDKPISQEVLSNLLWAAFGINRPESGKRTAATAFNCQDIDIYVVFQQGTYVYQAKDHRLEPVSSKDLCSLAATQDYARVAPVQLVYVSDARKINDRFKDKKTFYAAFHAGSISQNVYLYCASAGLGSVVRDSVDREGFKKALALHENQQVVIAQTVGYAKE